MEYESCIKDECGNVILYCENKTEEEIDEILEQHPEWYRSVDPILEL